MNGRLHAAVHLGKIFVCGGEKDSYDTAQILDVVPSDFPARAKIAA
jgi:hypothetical protein